MKDELGFSDFVVCWLRYLDDEEDPENEEADDDDGDAKATVGRRQDTDMTATSDVSVDPADEKRTVAAAAAEPLVVGPQQPRKKRRRKKTTQEKSWLLQKLQDMYLRARHKSIISLLETEATVKVYQQSFTTIVGGLGMDLDRSAVPDFLRLLLLDFAKKNKITELHVREFMEMYSLDGSSGQSVSWLDIERGLRDRGSKPPPPDRIFMEGVYSPLNPQSPLMRSWRTLQQICAVYTFLHVVSL